MSDFAASIDDMGDRAAGPSRQGRVGRNVAVFICFIVFVLSAYADTLNGFAGVVLLTGALLFAFPEAGRSALASTLVFTGVAVYTMPYIGLIYVHTEIVQTAWFALFIIIGVVLIAYDKQPARIAALPGHRASDLPLIFIYLAGGLFLWGDQGIRQVSFYCGWALALVHLERIHANFPSLRYRAVGLFAFAVVIGYFVTELWTGGGRIVQLSFALAPILLTVHYRTFRLNGPILGLAAAGLSFIGRLLRFGWSDGLAGLSVDSGASPITITSYLWRTKDVVLATGSIVDQWLLLFVNWFPRELWPDKPVGIGSTFVDLVIGREGVSAEHSLAIGFIGEHIFFLPHAWPVSVALLVVVIIVLRRSIARLCVPYRAPVIIFDVWLITLFWGGMAAFAARVWLALIPAVPYLLLIKWIDRRSKGHAVLSTGTETV